MWQGYSALQDFTMQSQVLTSLKKKAFENILRKGENAGCQHFLLFPQGFLSSQRKVIGWKCIQLGQVYIFSIVW